MQVTLSVYGSDAYFKRRHSASIQWVRISSAAAQESNYLMRVVHAVPGCAAWDGQTEMWAEGQAGRATAKSKPIPRLEVSVPQIKSQPELEWLQNGRERGREWVSEWEMLTDGRIEWDGLTEWPALVALLHQALSRPTPKPNEFSALTGGSARDSSTVAAATATATATAGCCLC